MGYILKKNGGAGAGDATAANQQKQIDQLTESSGYSSVLKDNADLSVFYNPTQRSVFKEDSTGESVFKSSLTNTSVFETNTKTVAELLDQLNVGVNNSTNLFVKNTQPLSTTVVTSFNSATLAGVATLLQTFLQANPGISIINISFSSGGVTQHDVLLTYNI